jgi:hypothetical protein
VRGAPVAGYSGHCADTDAETSTTIPKTPAQNSRSFMSTSQRKTTEIGERGLQSNIERAPDFLI